ncbi:EcoKI restriction-modification system protein HsdS [uncultured Dorea sp.]|uniref:restriction endonuclease subunit S n=1 Tax=Dorea formicigenerans TaxID=39486 RepID=UPI0008202936|nr:restriction endonuclease subunit S [uncultured Dorea sp.]SCH45091.1 EcoKI restriction-modification system protein HsdS [uncultured Dorea sp.]
MKSNYKQLGQFIRQVDVRNSEGKEENLLGVSVQKKFIPSIANTVGTDFKKYKVVKKGQFTYIPDTSRRGDKIGIALLEDDEEGLVSNVYTVFEIIDEKQLIPEYLMLWFSRPEFDRYARFKSHGSVREVMDWDEMCKVELPVPPYEKQKEIVDGYKAITERIALKQKINDNLSAQMRAYFKEYTANNASITGKLKDYSVMQYGYTETATTEPVGPKFLRITDIAQNYIDWNGVPYCPISEENHKKYVLSEGDVVVARTGATVGYAKMVGRNIPDSVFASFLVRIRPIDVEYRYYFGLAITSAEFLDFVQTNAGGSAQPQANPPLLGEFELSIPNKQSLSEFNKKISSFLGVIETNETEISKLHEVKDTMVKMLSSR